MQVGNRAGDPIAERRKIFPMLAHICLVDMKLLAASRKCHSIILDQSPGEAASVFFQAKAPSSRARCIVGRIVMSLSRRHVHSSWLTQVQDKARGTA